MCVCVCVCACMCVYVRVCACVGDVGGCRDSTQFTFDIYLYLVYDDCNVQLPGI